jgi:putative sterol carrier protein
MTGQRDRVAHDQPKLTDVVTYLSPEWIDAVREAVLHDDDLSKATADTELVLQQLVTETPFGDVGYFITFDRGDVYVQSGVASTYDVSFHQDHRTALEVHAGELNVLEAFQQGRIAIKGDVTKLTANQSAIAALDRAFSSVKRHTEY